MDLYVCTNLEHVNDLKGTRDKNEVIPMRQRVPNAGLLKKQGSLRGTMFITSEGNTLRIVITYENNTDIHVK